MTVQDLVETLERNLDIPDGKHLFAVFENNASEDVKGFIVADCEEGMRFPKGDIKNYPVLTSKELIGKYGLNKI